MQKVLVFNCNLVYNKGMKVEKELQMDEVNFDLEQLAREEYEARIYQDWLELQCEYELQRQYEFMQYAEDAANADAEFYGAN